MLAHELHEICIFNGYSVHNIYCIHNTFGMNFVEIMYICHYILCVNGEIRRNVWNGLKIIGKLWMAINFYYVVWFYYNVCQVLFKLNWVGFPFGYQMGMFVARTASTYIIGYRWVWIEVIFIYINEYESHIKRLFWLYVDVCVILIETECLEG